VSGDGDDLQRIRANAEMVVEQSKGVSGREDFGFDEQSVKWVEGFIDRARGGGDAELVDRLVSVFGSYLCECIVRCYGGQWAVDDENGCHVRFDAKNAAYPFAKVRKQFDNGLGDGIHSFFTAIPIVFRSLRPLGLQFNQPSQRIRATGWSSWIRKLFGHGHGR
jgi:hypothetical protein